MRLLELKPIRTHNNYWVFVPPTIGVIIVVALFVAVFRQAYPPEKIAAFVAAQSAPRLLTELKSADGRVVCYSDDNRPAGCLPVWLLDRPQNWVVMYPVSKPTGKSKSTKEKEKANE